MKQDFLNYLVLLCRSFFYLLLGFACLYSSQAQALPILSVDIANRNAEQIGKQLADLINAQFPRFQARYDRFLADTVRDFDWLSQLHRSQVLQDTLSSAHRQEVNGLISRLADATEDVLGDGKLSANEIWVLQFLLEQERYSNAVGFGAFAQASSADGPLLGYNLNGFQHPILRSLQAITVYKYADTTVVNIGFAGYLGILNGYNSNGLFIAYLSAMSQGSSEPAMDKVQASIAFRLRETLQQARRNNQTLNYLSHLHYPTSHAILLADNRQVKVLEQPQNHASILRSADSPLQAEIRWGKQQQIAAVDCFVAKNAPKTCHHMRDIRHWSRLRELAEFDAEHPAQVIDIKNIMLDQQGSSPQSIFSNDILHSIVFLPMERQLYLYTANPKSLSHPRFTEIDIPMPHRYTSTQPALIQQVTALLTFLCMLAVTVMVLYRKN